MPDSIFTLRRGTAPLLISIPHLGTALPDEFDGVFSDEARAVCDTDWHLDQLYDFADALGATLLGARVSRYVIDLNRPPDGQSLYPGQTTTGLCPTETFEGVPLYVPGKEPDAAETGRRRRLYWQPYHDALQAELADLRARHGRVLLWEAHSIAGVLPRLFDGKLPDLNFGNDSGRACSEAVVSAVLEPLGRLKANVPTVAVNGRFKGGYITRHYGDPASGVQAIQLEMCKSLYMNEKPPFEYRPEHAAPTRALLREMVSAAVQALAA